jgi:hypothetical protein
VTVGTQAAVLAGLDVTMFIEFNPPDNTAWVRQKKKTHEQNMMFINSMQSIDTCMK